jgi:hypothetical protein
MLPACPLSQVLVNSSRASWMIAARRGLGKVTSRERKAMHPAQLSLYRLSDNVGGVKRFLSVLLRALRRARHFALVEDVAIQPRLARNQYSGPELSPTHAPFAFSRVAGPGLDPAAVWAGEGVDNFSLTSSDCN